MAFASPIYRLWSEEQLAGGSQGFQQQWAEYWGLVKSHSSSVLAFYPFDEPIVVNKIT